MGFTDYFRFLAPPPVHETAPVARTEFSDLTEALYTLIAERTANFTMADALKLPAVIRGRSLLASVAAQMLPLAYRNGAAIPVQPRIVARPDPFRPRPESVSQMVLSLIDDGCSFRRLGDPDPDTGKPRTAYVLPHDEVQVTWDRQRFLPEYHWRGQKLVLGRDIEHIAINRKAGELHGVGPLRQMLPALAAVWAAEEYAEEFFSSGGIPMTVLQSLVGGLTDVEAQRAKTQWTTARDNPAAPAVLGKDWSLSFPGVNPQLGQMQEARGFGSTVVAIGLGIPGALLHVQTSGATITYTNPAGAIEDMVKSTLAPQYLAPIEAAWSDLLPGTQAVRFDLNDLQRADFAARAAIYATLIPAGVMSVEEARAAEGWSSTAVDTGHAFDPAPVEATA